MSRAEWIVSPSTHGGRMRSWSLSVFAAFAVPASCLYIYLASVERQRFLIRDGIQTLVFSAGPKQRSLQLLLLNAQANIHHMRWWYSGEHSCLPSSWPGFDSRPTHFLWLGLMSKQNSFCDLWLHQKLLDGSFGSRKELALPVGESNPGLPRDRRRYCPLY